MVRIGPGVVKRPRGCLNLCPMGYPKHLLNEGEELVLDLQPHWIYFARQVVFGAGLVALLILWVVLDQTRWIGWPLAALLVVYAGWVAWRYVNWRSIHFVVTDRRLVYRSGFVSKRGVEIPLERINNIIFHQRALERLIRAGDIDVESAGRDGQTHFDNVRRPDAVQQEIYRQMEVNARKQAKWATAGLEGVAAPAEASVPEQIEALARLRDQGHISAAEFEAKKAELLSRM